MNYFRWLLVPALLPMLLLGLACGRCCTDEPEEPRTVAFHDSKGDDQSSSATKIVYNSPWPMFGGTMHRNMANSIDNNLPDSWSVEEGHERNIKWVAELGDTSHSCPVIAGGRIFVGTNNEKPRDPKVEGDKGIMMCFRESDGKFLWQAVHEKLDNPDENDYPRQGIVSAPAVDGKRLYYVSNRCELVCADVAGDEKTGKAKIAWTLDMIKELKVYPTYLAVSCPLVVGDLVFVVTGNGVDPNNIKIKNPEAPSFLAVNKHTGKVVWQDKSPGKNILFGQWSSPAAAYVRGVLLVFFPGGDGWLYAFEAKTGKLVWKFDCNPKASVYKNGGRGDRSYFWATPVVVNDRLYLGVGQNPAEDGPGVGHLWCIDIAKEPKNKDKDLSPVDDNFDPKADVNKDSALVWHYGGHIVPKPAKGRNLVFGRTVSTVCFHEGLVYAAEVDGYLHCLDAATGKSYWVHDMKDGTWASPYYVDGKVFIGTEGGNMLVFKHGKEKKLLRKIDMDNAVQAPVVSANRVLYINTGRQLVAIAAE